MVPTEAAPRTPLRALEVGLATVLLVWMFAFVTAPTLLPDGIGLFVAVAFGLPALLALGSLATSLRGERTWSSILVGGLAALTVGSVALVLLLVLVEPFAFLLGYYTFALGTVLAAAVLGRAVRSWLAGDATPDHSRP